MFGIPLKYIALFFAILGIVAGAYFTVKHYNDVTAENAKLKIEVASVKAEKEQIESDYKNIVSTVDKNETVTREVNNHTQTIVREIQSAPVTKQCVESPAIGIALDRILKNER